MTADSGMQHDAVMAAHAEAKSSPFFFQDFSKTESGGA